MAATITNKIAGLKKRIKRFQKGVRECHRRRSGAFCGFCDAAKCQIDELRQEIKNLKKDKKGR
jgi:archaellum component FlaC